MAERVVLVIGNVTSKQYHEASLSVLQKHHQPKIVHVSAEDFYLNAAQLVETYDHTNTDRYDRADEAEFIALVHDLADKHLSQHGAIGAIIMDGTAWEGWGTRDSTFVESAVNRLEPYVPRWAVINGQIQYIG